MLHPGPVEKKVIIGLIVSLCTFQIAWTQVTSSTANRVDSLIYLNSPGEDPLFVFYQVNQVPRLGSLTAALPGTESYNFEWSSYNPAIQGFDPPFSSDANALSSTVSDLNEGGYRVRIWNGSGTDTTLMAWVMLDQLRAAVEKTPDDLVPSYKYTCDFLVVSGFVTPDTFTYYDPAFHDTLSRVMDFSFKWTSDNDDLWIPNDTIVLDPNITYQPPYEDTWYILTATDEMGMVDVDSVFYESIQTKAEFSVEYYDKVTEEYDADLTTAWSAEKGSLDARLTVKFTNESLNGATFEWVFLDTLGGIRESETTYNVEDEVEFTYETADEYYYPYMVSTSEDLCIDTFRLEEAMFVAPSQLVIPNVFTPNGDGRNDYFVFKHQSLQTCNVTIADRNGKIVYRKKIDDIYAWEGWDGNVFESDRRAPEGQYYFVVEAVGFDGIEYDDPNIIENWKINRSNRKNQTGGTTTPGGTDPEPTGNNLYTGWLYLYRHKGVY